MADQLAVPASDLAIGGWSNELGAAADLFESLNEAAASDLDHAYSGATPNEDTLLCALTALGVPGPGVVTLKIRGKKGRIVITSSVRFAWEATPGADSYVLQVGTSPGVWSIYDANVGNVTLSPPLSLAAGTYYYQVIPYVGAAPMPSSGQYVVTLTGGE